MITTSFGIQKMFGSLLESMDRSKVKRILKKKKKKELL